MEKYLLCTLEMLVLLDLDFKNREHCIEIIHQLNSIISDDTVS